MAEISYPFAAASAGGGSQMVSQAQWQSMSHLWGPDRIDFQLTNSSYMSASLPFYAEISGANLTLTAGAAWVGGFFYKNDSLWTTSAPTNSGAQPRVDLVVIRLDMTAGSVNLAVKQGQPAANPVEPAAQRVAGGIWELPIWAISLGANNGARTFTDRRRFDVPAPVSVPWNAEFVSKDTPVGNFVLDLDANRTGGQEERFQGVDGQMVTRSLSSRREYTPPLLGGQSQPVTANRTGYYRYIAPGTIQFSISIKNTNSTIIRTETNVSAFGVVLPVPTSRRTPQVFPGQLTNPEVRGGMPNLVGLSVRTGVNSQNAYISYQSTTSLNNGLDGLTVFPGKSEINITGVYETNDLD